MVRVAALGQVYQQLCGQLADLVVPVFGDVAELADDHRADELLLREHKPVSTA